MSGGMLYAVIAIAAWPGFAYLLRRIGRPSVLWQQVLAGASMAALWPLTLSLGAFGGVAVARLIRISAKKVDADLSVGADVSPATAKF